LHCNKKKKKKGIKCILKEKNHKKCVKSFFMKKSLKMAMFSVNTY